MSEDRLGVCEECGMAIDPKKPGWGHRGAPRPCGSYTFTVSPDLNAFLSEAPKDMSSRDLATSWIRRVLAKEDAERERKKKP